MCVDTVTKSNLDKSGKGWKVFTSQDGELLPDFFGDAPLQPATWLREKQYRRVYPGKPRRIESSYPYGWHIFIKKRDAKTWMNLGRVGERTVPNKVLYRVFYRKAHTLGWQMRRKVIVADEMKIVTDE